jgi:hypothetical protein
MKTGSKCAADMGHPIARCSIAYPLSIRPAGSLETEFMISGLVYMCKKKLK